MSSKKDEKLVTKTFRKYPGACFYAKMRPKSGMHQESDTDVCQRYA